MHVEPVADGAPFAIHVRPIANAWGPVDLEGGFGSTPSAAAGSPSRPGLVLVVAGRALEAAVAGAPLELAGAHRVRALEQPGARGDLHVEQRRLDDAHARVPRSVTTAQRTVTVASPRGVPLDDALNNIIPLWPLHWKTHTLALALFHGGGRRCTGNIFH